MGYSRQALYKRKGSEVRADQRRLKKQKVTALVAAKRSQLPRLGTRKIYHLIKPQMEAAGINAGRDTLFGWLREEGLLIAPQRRYVRTTNSKHWMKKYPNKAKDLSLSGPEQLWVSDITYIDTNEGWMYLSLITDAWSRKVVGYSVDDTMEASAVALALHMALEGKSEGATPMHHSDRGLQYCSALYTGLCLEHGMAISMTENGDPYENALAERMNRTFKEELGLGGKLPTKELVRQIVPQSVALYNNYRPHLALGMSTPATVHQKKEATNFAGSPKAEVGSAGEQPTRNRVSGGNERAAEQHPAQPPNLAHIFVAMPKQNAHKPNKTPQKNPGT